MNRTGLPTTRSTGLSARIHSRQPVNVGVNWQGDRGARADTVILKERFKKALLKKARRGFSGYPVATVAFYGPNKGQCGDRCGR